LTLAKKEVVAANFISVIMIVGGQLLYRWDENI